VPSRFFLWAHLYDPHRPYDPPEPYRSRFIDPYVGQIAFVDAQIDRLPAVLDRSGLLDRTIVIVAGDHGESLGDHGERDHGIFVYENVLRVPLIIRAPGFARARIGSVVRLVDVMPTALDLLGVAAPAVQGVSLRTLMTGERADLDSTRTRSRSIRCGSGGARCKAFVRASTNSSRRRVPSSTILTAIHSKKRTSSTLGGPLPRRWPGGSRPSAATSGHLPPQVSRQS
jgi:Sulfatase